MTVTHASKPRRAMTEPLMKHVALKILAVSALALAACSGGGAGGGTVPNAPPGGSPVGGSVPLVVQQQSPPPYLKFPLPTAGAQPLGIAVDGTNYWVAEGIGKLAKVTNAGVVTEYSTGSLHPGFVIKGPDGRLWFTSGSSIARMTTSGVLVAPAFTVPSGAVAGQMVSGPDGNVWFTEGGTANKVLDRVTTKGVFTEYTSNSAKASGDGVAVGPDKHIWFTEGGSGTVGYVVPGATSTVATEFATRPGNDPLGIVTSGSYLYFAENTPLGGIGRMTTAGVYTQYKNTLGLSPQYVSTGPNASIWFTGNAPTGVALGAMTTAKGAFSVATAISGEPQPLLYGSDGNLWFTDTVNNSVDVYVSRAETVTPSSISFTALAQTQTFTIKEANYTGSFYATSSNGAVATVTPASGKSPFTVTAVGPGKATITVSDNAKYPTSGNGTAITVTVTTSTVIVQ